MAPSASVITFSWYDYIFFVAMLLSSTTIGIYYGCFGSKQSTRKEYLTGGRKMRPFPIALSLIACSSSGEVLLGLAADVYRYGAAFWLKIISVVLASIATIYVYIPTFHNLEVLTIYEYLEQRFDKRTRQFASALFIIAVTVYLSLSIYTPALTFSAVTGLKLYVVLPIVSGICIFYTSIGGFKTVVWTDTIQFLIIFVALFTVCVLGLNSVGFATVWTKASESGRLDIFDFDPDPTKRDSFWIMAIGVTFLSISYTTVDQAFMQKSLAVETLRDASLIVIYYAIGVTVVQTVCIFTGLIMYAKYANCDPLSMKTIERNDQLLPYYVLDIAQNIPGLPGIFVAGIFGTSMSLQSAILNCLSGTLYSDFLSKFLSRNISEKRASNILKLSVVVTGIFCTLLVFIIDLTGLGALFPLIISLTGVASGPVLGVFTLGLLFPKANSKGAFYGALCGLLLILSIMLPGKFYESQGMVDLSKPLSTQGCASFNSSLVKQTLSNDTTITTNQVPAIFRISFYYYTLIGVVVSIVVGLFISYMTNKNDRPVKRNLISPVCQFLLPKDDGSIRTLQYTGIDDALRMQIINDHVSEVDKDN